MGSLCPTLKPQSQRGRTAGFCIWPFLDHKMRGGRGGMNVKISGWLPARLRVSSFLLPPLRHSLHPLSLFQRQLTDGRLRCPLRDKPLPTLRRTGRTAARVQSRESRRGSRCDRENPNAAWRRTDRTRTALLDLDAVSCVVRTRSRVPFERIGSLAMPKTTANPPLNTYSTSSTKLQKRP